MKKYLLITVLLSLAACNYSTSPNTDNSIETKENISDSATSETDKGNEIQDNGADTAQAQEVILKNGLLYGGTIFIATSKKNKLQNESGGSKQNGATSVDSPYIAPGVFISAPIFPNVQLLYANDGNKYPVKYDQLQELAQNGHYNFEFLRDECAQYSKYQDRITFNEEGVELTAAQIRSNYNAIVECSYEHFNSKPYFLPQLLEDVDLCKMHVGENFRMLTEADIHSFSEEFYVDLANVLQNISSETGTDDWVGNLYFSLITYIKDSEGRVKFGNLRPDVTERVVDFDGPKKYTFQNKKTLRCINDNRS